MLDFLKAFFRPVPPSGTTAKERLRLVLLSDHLSLAPDVVDALKRDLLEVISRYVEIDPANADVTFEQRETEVAMLASIPITGVRDRERPRAPSPAIKAPPIAPPAALMVSAAETDEPVTLAELLAESESGVARVTFAAPISLVLDGDDALDVSTSTIAEANGPDPADAVSTTDLLPLAASKTREPDDGQTASLVSTPRRRRRKKKANGAGAMPQGKLATGSA